MRSRKGLGIGLGQGYKNIVLLDKHIHSLSAKGIASSVNLSKYQGKWYDQASFPTFFDKGCEGQTAEYKLRPDGKVDVLNTCLSKKGKTQIKGTARSVSKDNRKLKVSFFPFIEGDYNILYLDKDYKHVIVGGYDKKYLWILTRDKTISTKKLEELKSIAKKKGYDVSKLNVMKIHSLSAKSTPVSLSVTPMKVKFSDGVVREVPFVEAMRPVDLENREPPKGSHWVSEEKKDGSLAFQYLDDNAVAYVNRRGNNKTAVYPELTDKEPKQIKTKGLTITQGEIYAFDGRTDKFEKFLSRDLLQNPIEAKNRMNDIPLTYGVFDILMKDGEWVADKPLKERKEILRQTFNEDVLKDIKVKPIYYNPDIPKHILELQKTGTAEGVVIKNLDSRYISGKSHYNWLKKKFKHTADVVIMGYESGKREIGNMKMGVYDKKTGKVNYVGSVGTGFKLTDIPDLKKKLDSGKEVFATVEYRNLTKAGKFRMPSVLGFREDIGVQDTHV